MEKDAKSQTARRINGIVGDSRSAGDHFDAHGAGAMKVFEQSMHAAADLHWLATLLTGSREIAADVAVQTIDSAGDETSFFSNWLSRWARRRVIAKALT